MPSRSDSSVQTFIAICVGVIAGAQFLMAVLAIVAAVKLADYEARAKDAAQQMRANLKRAADSRP